MESKFYTVGRPVGISYGHEMIFTRHVEPTRARTGRRPFSAYGSMVQ
jgi:hypothetical protein